MPSLASGIGLDDANSRITMSSSPLVVGSTATRSSSLVWPKREKSILPSCGSRCSEMSRLAMILMRDSSAARSTNGMRMYSVRSPSTRRRISVGCSSG
ncbi:hypothetical protein D3C71_1274010 [compost metagenome]